MPPESRIPIARIGAPHGTRGELRLQVFAEDPQALVAYGPLTGADGRRFTVESVRPGKSGVIAAFHGVADRTAAEPLTGTELFVDRSALPPAADDEFYHADLIGLAAVDSAGGILGAVVAVHNHGAGDILEIAPPRGETLLLPFTREVVPKIDLARRRLVLALPAEIEVRGEKAEERGDGPHGEAS